MGSLVLTVFSVSMLIFQFSCKKDANAQTTNTNLIQQNLITYFKVIRSGSSTASTQSYEVWLANIDGTNQHKVPIALPSATYYINKVILSPDCKTLVMNVTNYDKSGGIYHDYIYSCGIDGTSLKKIVDENYIDQYNGSVPSLQSVN